MRKAGSKYTERFKTVLIGLGGMGRNHLRLITESNDFELLSVVDKNRQTIAKAHEVIPTVTAFSTVDDFLNANLECDAAIVAVPTESHFHVAEALLRCGIHTLVEKPLAATLEECHALTAIARRKNVVLAVGHVERHNPVVRRLAEVINKGWLGKPIHFSITRVGGYPSHIASDTNVLLDLAVHDIDVLRFLLGPLQVVASCCHKSINRRFFDTAEILLRSRNGTSASVHVNWITPTKIRNLRVAGTKGVCFVDYILQTCSLLGGDLLAPPKQLGTDFESLVHQYQNSDRIDFAVRQEEPLRQQLEQFARKLRGQQSSVCLDNDGAAAVSLAELALRASTEGHSRKFY